MRFRCSAERVCGRNRHAKPRFFDGPSELSKLAGSGVRDVREEAETPARFGLGLDAVRIRDASVVAHEIETTLERLAASESESRVDSLRRQVAQSLGRNLAGNQQAFTIPLVAPYEMLEERIRRLDLRVSKSFKLPRNFNLQLNLDAYNALNNDAIQALNTTYGANWLQPVTVLDPRLLQISGQLTF